MSVELPWSDLRVSKAFPQVVKPWSPLVTAQHSVVARWVGSAWVPVDLRLFDSE